MSPKTINSQFYGTGRRKTSVARVFIKSGKGQIMVNNQDIKEYFKNEASIKSALQPLDIAPEHTLDIKATVCGGGATGQSGAISLGLARALLGLDENLKSELRNAGLLTRDSRKVERKKPGLLKARKRTQFSKR